MNGDSAGPSMDVQALFRLGEWGPVVRSGRTAEVWPARHRVIGQPVALKVFRLTSSSGQADVVAERFEREVRTMAALVHPNLVRILDAGVSHSGTGAIVLEWCDDTLADQVVGGQGRATSLMSWADASTMIDELADGLEAAYTAGVVAHGDLTPQNVLYGNGSWKVGDFGSASWLDALGAVDRTSLFSPEWAPPELPEKPCRQSDVFSLARLYLFATTGSGHHDSLTDAPAKVRRVVERALSFNAGDRHATASDFADALDAACGGDRAFTLRRGYVGLATVLVLMSLLVIPLWGAREPRTGPAAPDLQNEAGR